MNVLLPKELERIVLRQVDSGRFHSAEEVIGTALRALDAQDLDLDERATKFKAEIDERLRYPATPLDFAAVKGAIEREIGLRKAEKR